MKDNDFTYKSSHKFEILQPCTLNLDYFKRLFKILESANEESAKIELDKLKKKDSETNEQFSKVKEDYKKLFKVSIHIYGAKGAFSLTESSSIFDDSSLPVSITKIYFENHSKYKVTLRKNPINTFQINFDFSKPKVFDFNSSPSYATPNNSYIDVLGENESWVTSTFTRVKESLADYKNNHGWLHVNNIYDLFLWFLFIPLSFRLLYIINRSLSPHFAQFSAFFKVACYLYFFIITINIFRIIFNYTRWIFPNIEFDHVSKRGAEFHRYVLGVILLGIVITFICDIVKLIF